MQMHQRVDGQEFVSEVYRDRSIAVLHRNGRWTILVAPRDDPRPRAGRRSGASRSTTGHPNARSARRPKCLLKKQARKKPVRVGGSVVSKCNGFISRHDVGCNGGKFLISRH